MQKDDQLLSLSQKKVFSMWLKKMKLSQHLRLLSLTDKLPLKPWQLWNKASYFQLFALQSCIRAQLPLLVWLGVYIKSHKNWHDKKWILCIYFCCHWEANTAKMSERLLPIFSVCITRNICYMLPGYFCTELLKTVIAVEAYSAQLWYI